MSQVSAGEQKGWRPSISQEEKEQLGHGLDSGFWGRSMYFDRQGNPIDMGDWVEAFGDLEYKRVAEDTVDHWWISTVWLGLDHGFSPDAPPLIFETMVFDQSKKGEAQSRKSYRRLFGRKPKTGKVLGPDAYQQRYSTEEAALEGHKEAVLAAEAGLIRREDEE